MRALDIILVGVIGTLSACAWLSPAPPVEIEATSTPERAFSQAPERRRPPPIPATEHWVHQDAEMTNKQRRKRWFQERHRAPDGVDWRAIERDNGLAQLEKRNSLANRRAGPDGFGGVWVERGSDNQSGRMHDARWNADKTALYAGSSLGGIWRGTLEGTEWEPLGDNLYGGAHRLAVLPPAAPGGPDVLIAASNGGLIHRTVDGGQTWSVPEGIPEAWQVRRVTQTTDGAFTVFIVLEDRTGSHGLYRSVDNGASFQEIFDLESYRGDVWVPRDGGSDLYMLYADDLRISEDQGDSWVTLGAIPGDVIGGELAGSEAGAPRFWVAMDGHLWRSDDGGNTWSISVALEDYWGRMDASIVDVDVVAWGGVEVHMTTNGSDFDIVNGWGDYYADPYRKLHADVMGIGVLADGDGEVWYIGTDGGLYTSEDTLDSVENLSMTGLRVSQYYSTLTSSVDPAHVAAGAQDQGYQVTSSMAQSGTVLDFEQIISGDYGHLTSADGSHDYVYSVYPGFILAQVGAEDPSLEYIDFPGGGNHAWLPPIVAEPKRKKNFFFPGAQIHRYKLGNDDTWSPELYSEHMFSSDGYEYVSALTFSPIDPERAYAATNYGRLFVSEDKARTWTESSDIGPQGQWLYGAALVASSSDIDTVWVGGSGYGSPAVYRSKDGGHTWKPFNDGLPDTLVYALVEAPDGSGALFAGTETAAYRRDKGGDESWVDITDAAAPVTTYWSAEALQHENTIRFGTYGRGIWDYQLDPDGMGCFPPVDRDGDGVDCDTDCNDDAPDIYPGATEVCGDALDNNCDPSDDCAAGPESAALNDTCGCQTGVPAPFWWMAALLLCVRRRP